MNRTVRSMAAVASARELAAGRMTSTQTSRRECPVPGLRGQRPPRRHRGRGTCAGGRRQRDRRGGRCGLGAVCLRTERLRARRTDGRARANRGTDVRDRRSLLCAGAGLETDGVATSATARLPSDDRPDHAGRPVIPPDADTVGWRRLEVLAPAIELAERGYDVSALQHRQLRWCRTALAASTATRVSSATDTLPAGRASSYSPSLRACLHRLAEQGVEDFYRGAIARSIDRDMRRTAVCSNSMICTPGSRPPSATRSSPDTETTW